MRLIIRHLLPLFRSRRRIPFFFTTLILLTLACFLFLINHHQQQQSKFSPDSIRITRTSNNLTTASIKSHPAAKSSAWPIDDKGRSLKTDFLVLDWNGFFGSGANEGERVECSSSNTRFTWTRQQNRIDQADFVIAHDGQTTLPFDTLQINQDRQQYSMAFIMESEVHSSTGAGWARYNFKMTYNLDDSYPEPATYFDMNSYLVDLLKPPSVSFEKKEPQADVVWIISNCHAHNGRQEFVGQLMQHIKIDSYGACLNNRQGYGGRMTDNVDAYKKYKFVIAIENSNCVDYVTEKLVKAVESGSIPILAGYNGRPDYRRYMPDHSYLNIFDYPSIKALADDIKRIANNQTLYESYLWYKKHGKILSKLREMPLEEKIKHVSEVIGVNATMFISGIVAKEKSENKMCKLIRFIRQTPWQEIAAHKKSIRVDPSTACLAGRFIPSYFDSIQQNRSQASGAR